MGAGQSARTPAPPARESAPTAPPRSEHRRRGHRSSTSVASDDAIARRKRGPALTDASIMENRSEIAFRHARLAETSFEDRSVAQESHVSRSPQQAHAVKPECSEDTAWLDQCMTMELEASQEMVRSTRNRMEGERSAKVEALQKLERQIQISQELQAENDELRENESRQKAEIEGLKQQWIERSRQHDEEVIRLKTELRMARRHEEFLAKELEAQRAAAGRRLKDVQARSEQEVEALRGAMQELNDKCEKLSISNSLKMINSASNSKPEHSLNGDHDDNHGSRRP